jgi:flagellar basal body rod protein FlgC
MSSISSVAASGMQVASTFMQVSASNTANLLTDGYQARRVVATSSSDGSVGTRTSRDQTPGARVGDRALSNVDPAREIVDLKTSSFVYSANAAVIRQDNERTRSLIDVIA